MSCPARVLTTLLRLMTRVLSRRLLVKQAIVSSVRWLCVRFVAIPCNENGTSFEGRQETGDCLALGAVRPCHEEGMSWVCTRYLRVYHFQCFSMYDLCSCRSMIGGVLCKDRWYSVLQCHHLKHSLHTTSRCLSFSNLASISGALTMKLSSHSCRITRANMHNGFT